MITATHTRPLHEYAEVLFASTVQQSDHLSPRQIKQVVDAGLAACDGDCRQCLACVAQEYGDHFETAVARMRWCLKQVAAVYGPWTLREIGGSR